MNRSYRGRVAFRVMLITFHTRTDHSTMYLRQFSVRLSADDRLVVKMAFSVTLETAIGLLVQIPTA
jgi:hypothetical protein